MRPVVVTAILLVVLMFMSDTAAWSPARMCREDHKAIPCRTKFDGGWFQLGNDRCVKVFTDKHKDFWSAENACRRYKNRGITGHLVSIHSIKELCVVECTMYRTTTRKFHYWIGLTQRYYNYRYQYHWTDNRRYVFSHWARGQPDNWGLNEGCVEMNYGGWGLWNDVNCGEWKPYACGIRI